jgi:hypothetical protein
MTLSTLEQLEPRQAQRLLSAMARRMLPDPGVASSPTHVDESLYATLETEARRTLQISPKDKSDNAKSRLLKLVADEIARLALSHEDEEAVKQRLGGRGELPFSQYRVEFPRYFDALEVARGISTNLVIDALRNVDAIENIDSYRGPDDVDATVALAVKRMGKHYDSDKRILLITIIYRQTSILVRRAWQIYDTDIQLSSGDSPLDALKKFVTFFGLRFSLFNLPPTNLVVYEAIPLPDELAMGPNPLARHSPIQFKDYHFESPSKHPQTNAEHRISSAGILAIALAYAIDMDKYAAAMQKHGVTIPLHLDPEKWK